MEMDIAMNTQHILVLTGPDYEDLELWYPKLRLLEAGRTVTVAAPEAGATYHGKNGYPCISDACIHDIDSQDYQGLILPGGWMPDKLRREPKALELVREFNESAKMIAAICHGGWIAISAGVYHGVKVTGSLGIKDERTCRRFAREYSRSLKQRLANRFHVRTSQSVKWALNTQNKSEEIEMNFS